MGIMAGSIMRARATMPMPGIVTAASTRIRADTGTTTASMTVMAIATAIVDGMIHRQ